jgi:thiol-disulfide isomerase/thioredoxin
MSSNKEFKVILSKVGWCGHCTDFLPVFNESKNLIKNNKTLKNVNIDFEVYDMEQDKGIFETKYGELVDKVEGYPTVFLAQIKNDKLSKTIEIGHTQKSVDFIKLIGDAYKTFSNQTGGNNNEYNENNNEYNENNNEYNEYNENELYKQKYLKYKSKYLQYKAQKGGIINEKESNPCEKGKSNPIFTFGNKKIVKYTPIFGKYLGESFYKLFDGTSCDPEKPIELQILLDKLGKLDINQIFVALDQLLKDYKALDKKKFNHFNQLLLSLIIMYLPRIEEHLEKVTDTKSILNTLNKIKEIIDVKTGWCVKVKEKLKCGDKNVSFDLDALLQKANLLFLKNILRNLKNDKASIAFFKNLKITEDNLNNLACLCAQIIIEHHKATGKYDIPLLVIIVEIEASDKNIETFNRLNSLLSKILSQILKGFDSKLKNILLEVFKKYEFKTEYKDNIEKIKTIIQELTSTFNSVTTVEDKKKVILESMKKKSISDTFIPFINQIVIDILQKINENYSLLPEILYFLYQTFLQKSNKDDVRRTIFYYNTYYLRYINKIIIDYVLIDPNHCSALVGSVIQRLIANLTQDKITAINITILFDYVSFRKLIKQIYEKQNTSPKPDVFDEKKVLTCTFSNIDTLLSQLSKSI